MEVDLDRRLGIRTKYEGRYCAWFGDLAGISIRGYGSTKRDAVLDLYRKLVWTAKSHMDKVQRRLHGDCGDELDVNVSQSFEEDGSLVLVISDASGRSVKKIGRWKANDKKRKRKKENQGEQG